MYWMKNANTGKFELMDGQQRTLSLLQYCSGGYSINYQYFFNLSQTEKDKILDYELLVYICEGTDDERREWFQRINVAELGKVESTQSMTERKYDQSSRAVASC